MGREGPLRHSPTHPLERDEPDALFCYVFPHKRQERWGCELTPASGPTLATRLTALMGCLSLQSMPQTEANQAESVIHLTYASSA